MFATQWHVCEMQQAMHAASRRLYTAFTFLPSIIGLSAGPDFTLNGQCFMSAWTLASLTLRPMSRLASNTELVGFMATCK